MTNPASADKISDDELREIANIIDPHAFAEIRPDVEEPFRGMIEDDRQLALSKAGRILSARTQLASRQVGVTEADRDIESLLRRRHNAMSEPGDGPFAQGFTRDYIAGLDRELAARGYPIEQLQPFDGGEEAALQPSPEPAQPAPIKLDIPAPPPWRYRDSADFRWLPVVVTGMTGVSDYIISLPSGREQYIAKEDYDALSPMLSAHPAAVADKPEPFGWHNGYGQLMLHADREAMRDTSDADLLGRFDEPLYAAPLPAGRVEGWREGMEWAAKIADAMEAQQVIDHGAANTGGADAAAAAIRSAKETGQ